MFLARGYSHNQLNPIENPKITYHLLHFLERQSFEMVEQERTTYGKSKYMFIIYILIKLRNKQAINSSNFTVHRRKAKL